MEFCLSRGVLESVIFYGWFRILLREAQPMVSDTEGAMPIEPRKRKPPDRSKRKLKTNRRSDKLLSRLSAQRLSGLAFRTSQEIPTVCFTGFQRRSLQGIVVSHVPTLHIGAINIKY
jgi:hypothetical protein